MSDSIIRKPDKDFTKEADKLIPEAQELAKVDMVFDTWHLPALTCCAGQYPGRVGQAPRS